MKSLILTSLCALLWLATAQASDVTCVSSPSAPAIGGSGFWTLEFDLRDSSADILMGVELKNYNLKNLGVKNATTVKDLFFRSKDSTTQNFNRYSLSDPWASYLLFLPKDVEEIENSFTAYIYWGGASGSNGNFRLYCNVNP